MVILHYTLHAAQGGHTTCVEHLLSTPGIDLDTAFRSFYGRTPRGHAILAPHLPRFGLYLSYIFIVLGKVLMPIITFVSLSDIDF